MKGIPIAAPSSNGPLHGTIIMMGIMTRPSRLIMPRATTTAPTLIIMGIVTATGADLTGGADIGGDADIGDITDIGGVIAAGGDVIV